MLLPILLIFYLMQVMCSILLLLIDGGVGEVGEVFSNRAYFFISILIPFSFVLGLIRKIYKVLYN